MSFTDDIGEMTADCIEELGDPAWFDPDAGASVQTFAILVEATDVVGDLGQIIDKRLSVKLLKSAVGDARKGFVRMLGRRFQIDEPVPGADDGFVVQRYVREVPV